MLLAKGEGASRLFLPCHGGWETPLPVGVCTCVCRSPALVGAEQASHVCASASRHHATKARRTTGTCVPPCPKQRYPQFGGWCAALRNARFSWSWRAERCVACESVFDRPGIAAVVYFCGAINQMRFHSAKSLAGSLSRAPDQSIERLTREHARARGRTEATFSPAIRDDRTSYKARGDSIHAPGALLLHWPMG